MASLNKCMFIGNLTRDAELRYAASGTATSSFAVAVNSGFGEKQTTEFVNVMAFGKTAENVSQYLTKGKQVYVEGRLQTRSWDDDAGTKHYRTEVIANIVQLLGSQQGGGSGGGQRRGGGWDNSGDYGSDDLPFE